MGAIVLILAVVFIFMTMLRDRAQCEGCPSEGHVKEVAGTMSRDEELEAEAKAHRQAEKAKETLDHVKNNLEGAIAKARDKGEEAIDKATKQASELVR